MLELAGDRVLLTHGSGSSVELTRFGAHIVSWKVAATPGGAPVERLWMSTLSALDGSAPIRGGVPIAWPQFADVGPMPLHGFARERQWTLVTPPGPAPAGDKVVRAELALAADASTVSGTWRDPPVEPFPFDFALRYTIELTADSLTLRLTAANHRGRAGHLVDGDAAMPFTACLHSYFRTADSARVRLEGCLDGTSFVDKVDGFKRKQHASNALTLEPAAAESGGYVDRVYTFEAGSDRTFLLDVGEGLDADAPTVGCAFDVRMSASWGDFVVFNPGVDGKRGERGPDFDDDGFKFMVCLEPAVVSAPVQVAVNAEWSGSCTIRAMPSRSATGLD